MDGYISITLAIFGVLCVLRILPSRQERLNVSVGSISFLILISASRTIGPQLHCKKGKYLYTIALIQFQHW